MGYIPHCGGDRYAETYWLSPQLCDEEFLATFKRRNPLGCREIALHILDCCPGCGHHVYQYHSVDFYGRNGPQLTIPQKEHVTWARQLERALESTIIKSKDDKDKDDNPTRGGAITGEYTEEVRKAADAASQYHQRKKEHRCKMRRLHGDIVADRAYKGVRVSTEKLLRKNPDGRYSADPRD